MKTISILALVIAGISFILAVVSRAMGQGMPIMPRGVQPATFLDFANTCLLVAITFILFELAKKK